MALPCPICSKRATPGAPELTLFLAVKMALKTHIRISTIDLSFVLGKTLLSHFSVPNGTSSDMAGQIKPSDSSSTCLPEAGGGADSNQVDALHQAVFSADAAKDWHATKYAEKVRAITHSDDAMPQLALATSLTLCILIARETPYPGRLMASSLTTGIIL